jgi:HK97 family phage major capsid protein
LFARLFSEAKRNPTQIAVTIALVAVGVIGFVLSGDSNYALAEVLALPISQVELNGLYDKKRNLVYQMNDVSTKVKERTKPGEVPAYTDDEDKQFRGWDGELIRVNATIQNMERSAQLFAEAQAKKLEIEEGNGENGKRDKFTYAQKGRVIRMAETRGVDRLGKEERKVYDAICDEASAFENMIRYGEQNLTEAERAIVNDLKSTYINIERSSGERAQTVTTTGGGFTIPQGFNPDIYRSLKLVSPFFADLNISGSQQGLETNKNLFSFMETTQGNDIPWPTVDDTATVGELLAINTDAFANAADLTFGQIVMKAYKYSPKPMKVPYELMQDTGIDLPGLISDMLGTRLGRIVNTQFTTGDNTAKPQGIVIGASAGKTTAASAAITFPEILDLEHSVDPSYRKSPSSRFMFHDNILLYLKKLTIGSPTNDSRPVWTPGYAVGAPDTIDGFQYLLNQDMASTLATTNITMLFGDMKAYAIRQAGPFRLKFLTERFADADQVAWVLFGRFDGRLLNTSAIKKMTQV